MADQQRVLVVGGTGRTGRHVLEQLLGRGAEVRAIVRSARRLPARVAEHPALTVVEADLLALGDEALAAHVRGCDAVVSCLGHTISFAGVFGAPRDLVTSATGRLCRAIGRARPDRPVKLILMSSVSVHRPAAREPRRGPLERLLLWVLRGAVPPARDNQRAADYLHREIGARHTPVEWVVVRPDSLLDGDVSPYALHETLVSRIFAPGSTRRANVAHFMCELATNPETWATWAGKLPVIVDASAPAS